MLVPLRKSLLLIGCCLSFWYALDFHLVSYGVVRGAPEGKSTIQVGDNAPLDTDDIRKAHNEGKIILLMFGNPDHCRYCEKVWFNSQEIAFKYEKDVAFIAKRHRAAEFWEPEPEAEALAKRYGIVGEPWLFLIDKKGVVRHIFVGFAGKTEIEVEVKKMLDVANPH
ncbi:MAG: thioredoxin family protein [Deltaproteobacteria bacterium]|nr:thioredoxin family protein [Deltaproteobacteria bacterium]